jgi:hypothetical protein
MQGLGLTRINLAHGTTTQTLPGALILQVQPAPDGISLYVAGYLPTTGTTTPPHFIGRLNPQSLQSLAEGSWPDVENFALMTRP